MQLGKKPVALLAGLAAATGGLALVGPAAAQSSAPDAVTGTIAETSAVAVADLAIYVKPEDAIQASIGLGEMVHYHRLPGSAVTLVGDQYQLSVAPQELPADTVGDSGLVTFQVVALDADATPLGLTSATVRAVYDSGGSLQWVDPLAPTEGVSVFAGGAVPADPPLSVAASDSYLGPVTADLTALPGVSVPASVLDDDEVEPPGADDVIDTNDDVAQQEVNSLAVTTSSCTPGQGAGNVKVAEKTVWGTIGTGYPVDGNWSKMSYTDTTSVDFTATLGVASDSGGIWQQSATESKARGTGFNWAQKTYARSYRVGLDYGKIAHYYDRCPPSPPYYKTWEPLRYAGNYGENDGIQRPDWNTCRGFTSDGDWWRSDSTGSAYSLSYGVKMANTIGIDLSTRRNYNSEAKLGYWVKAGQRLCGNGGNPPGTAGKVMQRQ